MALLCYRLNLDMLLLVSYPLKSSGKTSLRRDTGGQKSLFLHGKEVHIPSVESVLPEYWRKSPSSFIKRIYNTGRSPVFPSPLSLIKKKTTVKEFYKSYGSTRYKVPSYRTGGSVPTCNCRYTTKMVKRETTKVNCSDPVTRYSRGHLDDGVKKLSTYYKVV